MAKVYEIRWHGRGGQGAKTAALLFGDACMATGKYFQAFPEYGPERMGAPVRAYDRLSDEPIDVHCGITTPNVVIVLDPTLVETQNVTEGLQPDGIFLMNTPEDPKQVKARLGLKTQKVYTVDASTIARECIGREIPNTPMLGALVRATKIIELETLLKFVRERLLEKFRDKKEVIEGNLKSIERAYNETKEA